MSTMCLAHWIFTKADYVEDKIPRATGSIRGYTTTAATQKVKNCFGDELKQEIVD